MNSRRCRYAALATCCFAFGCSHRPAPLPPPRYFALAMPVTATPAQPPPPVRTERSRTRTSEPRGRSSFPQQTFTVSLDSAPAPSLPPVQPCLDDEVFKQKAKGGRFRADIETARLANDEACAELGSRLEEVNRHAEQESASTLTFNAIHQYRFDEGGLYNIVAAPKNMTELSLQPGETVLGEPTVGAGGWAVKAINYDQTGQSPRFKIVIRPNQEDLHTNLVVVTDRRTYYCNLHSRLPPKFMVAVSWSYPQDEIARAAPLAVARDQAVRTAERSGPSIDLRSASYDFDIRVVQGKPSWTPQEVVADYSRGKTYIRFPTWVSQGYAPAFWLSTNKKLSMQTYRPEGTCTVQPPPCTLIYSIDVIVDAAELHLNNEKVLITRRR
jgi:type IV secretory pathway VirB9-like protein